MGRADELRNAIYRIGPTHRRVAYVALIAVAMIMPILVGEGFQDKKYRSVLGHLTFYCVTGGALMIIIVVADALAPRIWDRAAAFALAVVAGCAVGALATSIVLDASLEQATVGTAASLLLRRALKTWAPAMAGLFLLERSARRSAILRQAELDRRRLEGQMLEARLQVMQAQVEPHFLFNTLAHLQRLYATDPVRARRMLDSFCDYLRAALPQMRGTRSTLGRELELATAYLAMQQIRMGRRLRVAVTVPDELRNAGLPPMMLLSLTENAIKHGLASLREGGEIRIDAAATESRLRVSVNDTGVGLGASGSGGGSGVGLSNIRSRLSALHGERGRLSLTPNAPHGVIATIELPLEHVGPEIAASAGMAVPATSGEFA